jgi:tricorn protease
MDEPSLFSDPAIDDHTIVFVSDDAIWEMPAAGGLAQRRSPRTASISSPIRDSRRGIIAFAASFSGPPQLCVLDAGTGRIRQLSFFSEACHVLGWGEDGRIVFASSAGSAFPQFSRGWIADSDSGRIESFAAPLMSFSCDGQGRSVIGPPAVNPRMWQGYRGGARGEMWIRSRDGCFRLSRPVPGNSAAPLICGSRIYFLAADDGPASLFSCDLNGAGAKRETGPSGFAVHSPATDGRRIVYCSGGDLFLFEPPNEPARIAIQLAEATVGRRIRNAAAAEDLRDLDTSGRTRKFVVCSFGGVFEYETDRRGWSALKPPPEYCSHARYLFDDKLLAVIAGTRGDQFAILATSSDDQRVCTPATGLGRVEILSAAASQPIVAVANDRHELFAVSLPGGATTLIDQSAYHPITQIDLNPSGTLSAYTLAVGTHRSVLRVARTDAGGVVAETDPPLCDFSPRFVSEKTIIFLSLHPEPESESDFRTSVYLWDFTRGKRRGALRQLRVPARAFSHVLPVGREIVLVSRAPAPACRLVSDETVRIWEASGERVLGMARNSLLIQVGSRIRILQFQNRKQPRVILDMDLNDLVVGVDRPRLWQAALEDTCRLAAAHAPLSVACDWDGIQHRYGPMVERASSSRDIDLILNEILGHLGMSHAIVTRPVAKGAKRQGWLAVDTEYDAQAKAWRIARIPQLKPGALAPLGLADPSLGVHKGDLLLAVDDERLNLSRGPSRQLCRKAGQPVRCLLESAGGQRREVVVEALASERRLRYSAWLERRERLVARVSQPGALYLHLLDTSAKTRIAVERWLLCHQENLGLIVDLRYNEGGAQGTEIATLLARKPLAEVSTRWSRLRTMPVGTAERTTVVLVNRFTSSGGELVAELLRQRLQARIVGERTFGAGVGHTYSRLLPSGSLLWLPEMAIATPPELAAIENRGVIPDVYIPWSREWMHGGDGFILEAVRQLRQKEGVC